MQPSLVQSLGVLMAVLGRFLGSLEAVLGQSCLGAVLERLVASWDGRFATTMMAMMMVVMIMMILCPARTLHERQKSRRTMQTYQWKPRVVSKQMQTTRHNNTEMHKQFHEITAG